MTKNPYNRQSHLYAVNSSFSGSITETLVLKCITYELSSFDGPFVSFTVENIMERCGIVERPTVRKALKKIEKCGILAATANRKGGRGNAMHFAISLSQEASGGKIYEIEMQRKVNAAISYNISKGATSSEAIRMAEEKFGYLSTDLYTDLSTIARRAQKGGGLNL